jgi:hypothetical protein
MGRGKPVVAIGYLLPGTALSVPAAASSRPLILLGRMVAWSGKVFGLHRAADTASAVLGSLLGVWLLAVLPRPDAAAPYRHICRIR